MSAALSIDDLDDARAILAEVRRRADMRANPPLFFDPEFPKQYAFQTDRARRKAALCTRRAGKSYGLGSWLCEAAWSHEAVTCGYIALTSKSAKGIMWRDVLKTINRRLNLGARFVESDLSVRFPNESVIFLAGADATPDEMEKFLGQKFKRIGIDEGASFRQDLRRMTYEMLEPGLVDNDGDLAIIGTPGDVLAGLFYDVTKDATTEGKPPEKGWSVHRWSAFDNPFIVARWTKFIAELKKTRPGIEETPAYKRMYLGQWHTDDSQRVYRYDRRVNWVAALPEDRYTYVLGVDLGFNDDSAFSLLAYSLKRREVYVVRVYKKPGMDVTDVATRLEYFTNRYPISRIVIDGAAKQAVEELRRRFGIPLEAADKRGKAEFIDIMNGDFATGTIKLVGEDVAPLEKEYGNLIWDRKIMEKKRRREEHAACPNHACFAAGTLVETEHGRRPIELVAEGDRVWTRSGLKQVLRSGWTGHRETIIVEFSNGSSFRCTPDHPVWTETRGWVRADALLYADRCVTHAECDFHGSTDSLSSASLRDGSTAATPTRPTQTSPDTSAASAPSLCARRSFTATSGSRIMAQFRRAITSIIATTTRSITTSQISHASLAENIGASMPRIGSLTAGPTPTSSFWLASARSRPPGMAQKKGWHGIARTAPRFSACTTEARPSNDAQVAAPASSKTPLPSRIATTAATSALLSGDATLASTMSTGNVLSAGRSSGSISTANRFAAVAPVRVTSASATDVYNVSVAEEPEFFANGVLVHNCDATLYAFRWCYSYLFKKQKPDMRTEQQKVDEVVENDFRPGSSFTPFWER